MTLQSPQSSIQLIVKVFGALLVLTLLFVATRFFNGQQWITHSLNGIRSLGALAGLAFIGIYILAAVFCISGALLTLGAGIVFGILWGSVYAFIAASCGATVAFLVGRYGLRGWVSKQIERNPRFQAIDEAIARAGLKIVLLTRLSPLFPYTFLNYAFGITQISLKDFVLGCVGMIPGTLMYVYIGSVVGDLTALTGQRVRTPGEWILYGVGLMATIAVTLYLTRIARQALEPSVSTGESSHVSGDR